MSELCAEQAAIEEEIKQLEEQLKAKAKAIRKLSEEIIPAKMARVRIRKLNTKRWFCC